MPNLLAYFDNLKIRTKLLVGYGLMILFLLVFAIAAGVWVKRIEVGSHTVFQEITPVVGVLRDLRFSGMQLIEAIDTVVIIQGIDAYTPDEARKSALVEQQRAIERRWETLAAQLDLYAVHAARRAAEASFRDGIRADGAALLAAGENFLETLRTHPNSLRRLLEADSRIDQVYEGFAAKVGAALAQEAAELAEQDLEVQALIARSLQFIAILTVLAIAAALVSAHVISNRIVRPLLRLRDETTRVADGGTVVQLEGGADEVGQLTRALVGMMRSLNESTEKRLTILRQVASTVSHELRNPLAAVRASVAVLRAVNEKQGGTLRQTFERIDRSIERCTRIIMSLVEYTHLEDVDRKAIEIDMWLSDWLDRYTLPDGVTLERELNSAVVLEVDPHRLGQALGCLVDNAVHAVTSSAWHPPAGHRPHIILRTETVADQVRLTVSDNGCGIPAANLVRIFEPLFTTKNFGVGLGLSLAKQIVEFHGGTIAVTSIVNEGSGFTVTLPQRAAGEVTLFDDEPDSVAHRKAA
jgi:signal transduction histidine kinase